LENERVEEALELAENAISQSSSDPGEKVFKNFRKLSENYKYKTEISAYNPDMKN
jgi:hypothetical protein